MRKNHYIFTSALIGCCLVLLPFSGIGQQRGGPAGEFPEDQAISTLGNGDDHPRFMLMAPPAANLDQYRNGPFNAPINTCTNWENGNLNAQQAHYIEGWSVPYRCVMTDLPLNTSITLVLGYDIRHSSKNALDYLTYYHRMSPHDIFCDANHHSPECVTPAAGAFTTFPIPAPSSAGSPMPGMPTASFNSLPAAERLMVLYGGTITGIAYGTQGDLNASQSETTISVTFTVTQSTATLAWGGHIATRVDWGEGNAAAGISGSPYHMRLKSWNLNNLGNTDRSLSAGAVGPPCVVSGPSNVCANSTQEYCVTNQSGITYNWTVSGGGATIVGSNTGNCVTVQAGNGNYTVMVSLTTDNGFCSDCSKEVTVEPIGVCSIDGEDVICPGTTSHHCAPPGGTSYSWSVSGGGSISGPSDQECVTVIAANSCNTSYTLNLSVGGPNCGSTCTKTVLVKDDAPPSISCPVDITLNCGASTLPASTGSATATDNCDMSPTITSTDNTIAGSCGAATINRTWRAEDNCTNSSTCLQVITVNPAPQAAFTNLPGNIAIDCDDAPPSGTMLAYSNGQAGACAIAGNATGQIAGSHNECGGAYTESWTFTDECDRTITHSRTISVNPAPQAAFTSLPGNIAIDCDDAPPSGTMLAYSNGQAGACAISGSVTGQIAGNHNECGGAYTESWSFTDECDRTISHSRTISVNPAPQAAFTNLPGNITIECDEAPPSGTMLAYSNGQAGACAISGSVTGQIAGSHNECGGSYSESWTFTDECGRATLHFRIISVNPAPAPAFVDPPGDITISCIQVPPAPTELNYTNGKTGACEISGSVLSEITGGLTVCGGSYRETWRLEDPCPDRPAIEYSREITVIDDTPPSGLCPSDIVVYCLDNIPCPDATDPELLGMIDMFETSYLDACGGVVTVSYSHASELQECSDPDGDGTYTFGRTFYFDISDDCGNTITCDVTYSGVCQPFCTFTQGFWGNPNGKANGLTSKQILEILLMPQQGGSITVGGGPNNCGFKVSTAQCILNILPAGGPSVPFSQNFQLNCNKQLKNTLAGQVLALSLNIRYNQHFNGLQLGTVVLSQSCVLTSSQITALGLNSNSTVNDLINLANKFLASPCNGTIYPNGFGGLLTNAVAALNEYWDECHVENNLCEAKSRVNESSENDSNMEDFAPFEDLNLSPNPASTVLRVAFTTDKSEVVYLRIFNLRGQLIKIIEFVAEEGENATEMDLAYLKSGIYWLNLANDETTIMKRFVVFRE